MRGHLLLKIGFLLFEFGEFALDCRYALGGFVKGLAGKFRRRRRGRCGFSSRRPTCGVACGAFGRGTGSPSGTALLAFAGTCLFVRKRILAVLDGLSHVQIILHATGQVAHLAADQRELLIGDAFEQIPVMGDDDQSSRPSVEQILHHGEHVGVEIIAGLIHDEHVRLVQ